MVVALRFRSGHNQLNKFAFMMTKVQSPHYSECGNAEEVYHIAMECKRNEVQRFNKNVHIGIVNRIVASPCCSEAQMVHNLVDFKAY